MKSLAFGLTLLAAPALAQDPPPARQYIVENAFPGWQAVSAAALIDARCRSLRAPVTDFLSSSSPYNRCQGGVADFLGLWGAPKTIDAATLASDAFAPEQRSAVVKLTDQLEDQMKAEALAREKAHATAVLAALEQRHRIAEHRSAGMAAMGPATREQAMQARNEARVKRMAEARKRFLERQAKNAAGRKVTTDAE